MRWAIVLALLLAQSTGCHQSDTPTGIRLIGLDHGSCEGGTPLFGSVPLLAVPEGSGEFSSVTFMIEGMEPIIINKPPFEVLFETLDDGPIKIGVTGIDAEGETKSTSVVACVDNNGPRLTIRPPPASITVEDDELAIIVEKAQDGRKVQGITASLDIAGVHQEVECSPLEQPICLLRPRLMEVVLDPGQVVTGKLTVTAWDSAGHETVEIHELEARTHLLWKKYIGGNLSWAPLIIPGDKLAIGTSYSFVSLMDLKGAELCTYQVPNTSQVRSGETFANMNKIVTPLVSNKDGTRLFFATMKAMWALDIAADGSTCALSWRRELVTPQGDPDPKNQEYYEESTFAYSETHDTLFISLYDGEASPVLLEAINASSGDVLGQIAVGSELGSAAGVPISLSPVLSADGGTLYIGRRGLFAINVSPLYAPTPGEMTDITTFVATDTNFTSAPLLVESLLYASAWDGMIYALDAETLTPAPGFSFEQVNGFFKSKVVPSADGETLFAANEENAHLYAFDAITGAGKGKINIGKAHTSYPVPGPDGTVYITTLFPEDQIQLSAVAFPEMKLRWVFAPQGHDTFQAPPVIHQNTLYVGNNNGFIYALDIGADGP